MIKFFRIIRKNLILKNKVSKYLIYAIGEIILVVIGIFIAIQLNEWNLNRVEKKQYTIVLENLKTEFIRNKDLLTTILIEYDKSIEANVSLMKLFTDSSENFSSQKIDTLLGKSTNQVPFYPLQPVLDEMLVSGKIKSIPSKRLKQNLFDWMSTIKWFHFDYDLLISFSSNEFNPYINKHWSWKNIDIAVGSQYFDQRSVLTSSQKKLFQELEFENLIDTNLFHTDRLSRRLNNINILIDKILQEIEIGLSEPNT